MTESNELFDNKPIVDTIILMRIYDVLMANLRALDPAAASMLYNAHREGAIFMPLPAYDPERIEE